MILLSHIFILFHYFSFVKLQITDTDLSANDNSSDVLEDTNVTIELQHVTILGTLSDEQHIQILHNASIYLYKDLNMSSRSIIVSSNPLLTMLEICEIGSISSAKVIIAGHTMDDDDLTLMGISYVAEFYNIPLITITSRQNIFSDKALYNYIIRLTPPYLYEADAWYSMIQRFKYAKVVLINSYEEESRMVAARFQMLTDDSNIHIERTEEYSSNTNFTALIYNLTSEDRVVARVFIIHARPDDIDGLLSAVVGLQKLENFVWIINEHALVSKSDALFDGLLGVRLHDVFSTENLLIDAAELIKNTFVKFLENSSEFWSTKKSAINCSSIEPWQFGKTVYKTLITTNVQDGRTGNIEFNSKGDRIESFYEIINIQHGQLKVVGTYRSNTTTCQTSSMCREIIEKTELQLNEQNIIWPNGLHKKPDGIRTSRNISVVTIIEKPFIFARAGNNCDSNSEILCPRKNLNSSSEAEDEQFCCYGYCIELLHELSKKLSFAYTLHLVTDGKYGFFERDGDDKQKRWDGMIGELLNYQADMIMAPLSMNPERAEDIEFTKPFKYHGTTILVRRNNTASHLSSFLQPFNKELWLMVLLCIHVIAVVLYLLDRLSPTKRFHFESQGTKKGDIDRTIEIQKKQEAINLSQSLWFTWGILLNSGIGEETPKSFPARVLGMVWAGFAMIMVASYTANLAAFLVLDRPEESLSGINDARLRNPQESFTFATVKGSSVDMHFKQQVEFATMYRTMESKNYGTVEEAIADLRNGKLHAFIWDSPRLEYEASQDCDLVTAGELFGRSSYGVAMRKKDAWISPLSHSILTFHEEGFMEKLDTKWIFTKGFTNQCIDQSRTPATLGFRNMLDVFVLVAGGMMIGVFLLIIEVLIKRRRERIEKQKISRTAVTNWRKHVEKRRNESLTISETDTRHQ